MSTIISGQDRRMAEIAEKVEHGERLTLEDGVFLYESDDLPTIGQLANRVNLRKNGKKVYFVDNMSLYFTNVCEEHCAFCHFRRDEGQPGAYTLSPEEMFEYIDKHYHPGLQEFHITGGHNANVPFKYYVENIRALKKRYPNITIKAHTAAEIEFFSRLSGVSYKEVLQQLMDAGLDTMPGGGAEILSDRYRKKMHLVDKASTDQWLEIQRTAHLLGMKTHATMLFGSIETLQERIQHMIYLRELQDETGGFMVFIPNAVQPASGAGLKRFVSATDNLKTIAISRLMLDNIQHIKAYFINLGTQLTQIALNFGASDAHGTIIQERISHAAGALSPEGLTRDELVFLIKGAGRTPVERDTFYNEIKVY
ncbi:aminofutalosine synthase MqnE [Paenibacillus sp. S-38]|uniref:aminofutalosine synthase MqnE n=1 Tax=Paenibacillus sp. S-38 TaxID=3416710 RepID=UPI003CEF8EBE